MSSLVGPICLVAVFLFAPARAHAVQYTLQVGALIDDAFAYFIKGPIGRGEGELQLTELERSLDQGATDRGALLYDRDLFPAGELVARSLGAVAMGPTGYSSGEEKGLWKTVRWEGRPGERVVWILRPASMHHGEVAHLAIGGTASGLRYHIPYRVTLSPTPSPAVAYPLAFLRGSEDGTPLWERYLVRAVDLRGGLAAVVGVNSVAADWVYLVIASPPEPATFRTVVGWARRGSNDRIQAGTGGGIRIR